ncbi:MAG: pentapeptide repeat-containing protein, partial [Candidatus Omnitrophica bacterium]|nr:pentapeptide repeat-containing protein [Candidatus Omnitrophota bacterium]
LKGAYLSGADVSGAYLRGADLRGAYLRGAYLGGAKEYINSHDFTQEIIRRHKNFTPKEWQAIGQIFTFKYCWEKIIEKFKKEVISIARKLEKDGFDEYIKKVVS